MRKRMMAVSLGILLSGGVALVAFAQEAGPGTQDSQAAARMRIAGFLRHLYGWGPEFEVDVGPLLQSRIPGLFSVLVKVREQEGEAGEVYLVSPDGRYVIQGDLFDTSVDPYAETRAAISTSGWPARGPGDAPITIVEYADFQCPDCARLHPEMKKILSENPDVRLVFKDFPLTDIHKWAMEAHIAGQCAFQQSPEAFWKLHDYFFEHQQELTPENLALQVTAQVRSLGIEANRFDSCRQDPQTRARVEQSVLEGNRVGVPGTPSLYVSGRQIGGPQPLDMLRRVITYERARNQPPSQ